MNKIINFFSKLSFFINKAISKWDKIHKEEMRIISFFLSCALAVWEIYGMNTTWDSKKFVLNLIAMTISIYLIISPCLYYFRRKFMNFFSEHIFFSMGIIIYFMLLIPVVGELNLIIFSVGSDSFVIKLLHVATLLVCIGLIVAIISRQFMMVIFNRKKIQGVDILMVFSTYIILGLTFGSFYYMVNLLSPENLFLGVEKPTNFNLINYLNHIYISLGYLSTVGAGSISTVNIYMRLTNVGETILGIFLTSFSLGFIFSVVGVNSDKTEIKDTKFYLIDFIVTSFKELKQNLKMIEDNNIIESNKIEGDEESKTTPPSPEDTPKE